MGNNNDKYALITIMFKVKREEEYQSLQSRRRNSNRAYSPTVLHKVLAWCLSLCWGRQDGAVCARTPACTVCECGDVHLWPKPWTGPPCGCRRRCVQQLLRQPHTHSSEHDCAPAIDVCTGTLNTRDAVDHTLPAVAWNCVLGVN